MTTPSVLFVCLGNICRSPLAEAAFAREAKAVGMDVFIDSAGTGDWHIGQPPDKRARAVAKAHGIDIDGYRARQVTAADFEYFTHMIALDAQNLADLEALRPEAGTASLSLLLDHVPGREGQSVADPYHGDARDFEATWDGVLAGAKGLIATLASR